MRPVAAGVLSRVRDSDATDAGLIALLTAILAPILLVFAAFAVDIARWYVEAERVQKVADAASLAGVVYMPQDFAKAKSTAIAVAASNGYVAGANITITVVPGPRPSQLQVTVTSSVANSFATIIGIPRTTIGRTAISDYNGPAPMGSPCNTFGNEPFSGANGGAQPSGSTLPGSQVNPLCVSNPLFWATIEGPNTDKIQGDRYMTRSCSSGVDGCTGGKNDDFNPNGYFFIVRILDPSKTGTVHLQLYDPAWVYTSVDCTSLPASFPNVWMNQYATTDSATRYDNTNNTFCTGDYSPGGTASAATRVDTSFALRAPTDTGNPVNGAPVAGCTAQYKGQYTAPTVTQLQQYRTAGNNPGSGANAAYIPDLAKVFHQWTELCAFTPTKAGDYYLQVRTNVAMPSGMAANALIATGNSAVTSQSGDNTNVTGAGANQFAMRATSSDNTQVSIAGFERMPIDINASNPTTNFNLIRVLPGAAGKYIKFTVFDPADGSSGTIQVQRPNDATGSITSTTSIPGCVGSGVTNGNLTNCTINVSSSNNNGKLQTISVPIPSDYNCNFNAAGGCWYRVQIKYSQPTDITTWNAVVQGDPVRIIQ